jgi:hypothetical protein
MNSPLTPELSTKAQAIRLICGKDYVCNQGVTDPALAIVKDLDNVLFFFITNLNRDASIPEFKDAYNQLTQVRDLILDCISHPDQDHQHA